MFCPDAQNHVGRVGGNAAFSRCWPRLEKKGLKSNQIQTRSPQACWLTLVFVRGVAMVPPHVRAIFGGRATLQDIVDADALLQEEQAGWRAPWIAIEICR